jgi:hypothetical protein
MTANTEAETKLLLCAETNENFLKSIVTGDEIWVYDYEPETKHQSSHWISPSLP